MKKLRLSFIASILALLVGTCALAHQSIEVNGGEYRVIVGYLVNPAYSGQMNGIDLAVRNANNEALTGLEQSLEAWVVGPDGTEVKLTLRANGAKEGWYTGNFIPTVAGNYTFRVRGFIGEVEIDLHFDHPAHSDPAVMDATTISVP